jgi:hypothetical protein
MGGFFVGAGLALPIVFYASDLAGIIRAMAISAVPGYFVYNVRRAALVHSGPREFDAARPAYRRSGESARGDAGPRWEKLARASTNGGSRIREDGSDGTVGEDRVEVRMEGSGAEDAAVATGRPLAPPGGDV